MGKRVRIIGIRKDQPDIHLYVLALIALARQLQEEETAAAGGQSPAAPDKEDKDA
jgi:hypothetical protein